MRDKSELIPAIIFVESPSAVCTLDRAIFDSYPSQKIILLDGEDSSERFFSDEDLLVSTSFMDRKSLDRVYFLLASQYRVMAVLGFNETSVFAAAYLADKFQVEGIGTEVALRCRDKHRMTISLRQGGVRTPNYFVADAATRLSTQVDAIGGYPVVCKPIMGFASCGVIRADDEITLQRALRRIRLQNKFVLDRYYESGETIKNVLVQSFIAGDEVAIDGYVQDGKVHTLAIIDKPDVSNGPYFDDRMHVLPSKLNAETQNDLRTVAQASVLAVGLNNSLFHLEARISDGQIHVLEIAARVGFMRSVQDAFGIDICAIMVALKMGDKPSAEPTKRRYAGNLCLTADKIGQFIAIENIETVMRDPRIVDVPRFVSRGARVAPAPDSNSYVGYILSAADDYDSVVRALRRASTSIDVIIE